MRKKGKLLSALSHATKAGGGVHKATEIAFMLGEKHTLFFTKFLTGCVQLIF